MRSGFLSLITNNNHVLTCIAKSVVPLVSEPTVFGAFPSYASVSDKF